MKPIYLVTYGKPKLLLCHAAEYDIIITQIRGEKKDKNTNPFMTQYQVIITFMKNCQLNYYKLKVVLVTHAQCLQ